MQILSPEMMQITAIGLETARAQDDRAAAPEASNATRFPINSTVRQFTHRQAQRQFSIVSLKPAGHRYAYPALRLGVTRALHEEIRIATEIVGQRERDRINPILEYDTTGGRKPGDTMRQRSDEPTKCGARRRRADPAISFG